MPQKCKYVILVGDGMADRPLKALGGKTVLEAAHIPNMNWIAKNGIVGTVSTVPKGMHAASDVANLSLFGYDPKKYYPGRGPLEALNMGIKLSKGDIAFRCNTLTIKNGKMHDFTAGHIKTKDSRKLIKFLDKELGGKEVRFYPGVSYRHLAVMKGVGANAKCTPPHDISGKDIAKYLPKGRDADIIEQIMFEGGQLLREFKENNTKCNMIWLWGQGKSPSMPAFKKKYKLTGSVISAVDLINGIGVAIGLKPIKVPGATGYLDTNYVGKAQYALRSLNKHDYVYVHVESPDEAGHEGNLKHKLKAIQDFDKYVVGNILKGMKKFKKFKILVLPDHPTPISLMTHSGDPVPFVLYSSDKKVKGVQAYNEKTAKRSKIKFKDGPSLIRAFLK
jgi:2,3-bisphosphoglycerate-independent phosphoglycerate mutase